jgi:hypothetical protein
MFQVLRRISLGEGEHVYDPVFGDGMIFLAKNSEK